MNTPHRLPPSPRTPPGSPRPSPGPPAPSLPHPPSPLPRPDAPTHPPEPHALALFHFKALNPDGTPAPAEALERHIAMKLQHFLEKEVLLYSLVTDGQLSYGTSSHPDAEGGVTLVTLKGPPTHVSALETKVRTSLTNTTLTCGRGSGAPFTISDHTGHPAPSLPRSRPRANTLTLYITLFPYADTGNRPAHDTVALTAVLHLKEALLTLPTSRFGAVSYTESPQEDPTPAATGVPQDPLPPPERPLFKDAKAVTYHDRKLPTGIRFQGHWTYAVTLNDHVDPAKLSDYLVAKRRSSHWLTLLAPDRHKVQYTIEASVDPRACAATLAIRARMQKQRRAKHKKRKAAKAAKRKAVATQTGPAPTPAGAGPGTPPPQGTPPEGRGCPDLPPPSPPPPSCLCETTPHRRDLISHQRPTPPKHPPLGASRHGMGG